MIDQSLPPNKSYTKSLGKWVSGDKSHEHLLKAKNMRDIYRERVQVFTSFFNPFKKGVLFIFQTVTFFTSDHIMLSNFQYAQQSWMEFKRIDAYFLSNYSVVHKIDSKVLRSNEVTKVLIACHSV